MIAETVLGLMLSPVVINGVIDGNTVDVKYAGRQILVSLYGIDAPEKKQPYWAESTKCAKKYLLGKKASILTHGNDAYGRQTGEVIIRGRNQNVLLLANGCAWVDPKQLPTNRRWEFFDAHMLAQKNRVGLWALADPIEPWVWRKKHGVN